MGYLLGELWDVEGGVGDVDLLGVAEGLASFGEGVVEWGCVGVVEFEVAGGVVVPEYGGFGGGWVAVVEDSCLWVCACGGVSEFLEFVSDELDG